MTPIIIYIGMIHAYGEVQLMIAFSIRIELTGNGGVGLRDNATHNTEAHGAM